MAATRGRILDVASELLGQRPEASMSDIAAAADVVRRTVYGHFPTRRDLVQALAVQAADDMVAVLSQTDRPDVPADEVWGRFVERLWPLTHRYRVLIALRRSDSGDDIHAALRLVDAKLATLVQRGQDEGVIGTHLPPDVLARLGYASVFSIADEPGLDVDAAAITSLLTLGVAVERAHQITRLG
jgi:AcrR family transcriptional regulator